MRRGSAGTEPCCPRPGVRRRRPLPAKRKKNGPWRSLDPGLQGATLVTTLPPPLHRPTGDFILARKPSFAHYLRDTRIRRGLSVSEVAEQVGVSTASIYFWETDHCRPRNDNLTALCKALKLPIRATRAMAEA
jgi:DNA-binding XRE family transcriptional regulator